MEYTSWSFFSSFDIPSNYNCLNGYNVFCRPALVLHILLECVIG